MDRICIRNVEVHAKHGVLSVEKKYKQKFYISATLYLNLREAGKSDDLKQTIDYADITLFIKEFVENNTYDLIEKIAEELAEKLLIEHSRLQKICIEVSKPEAQINADFETVSVEITRSRHMVFLSLGSNVGDREANLNYAIDVIEQLRECRVINVSEFINTKPYGVTDQDDFLNACIEIETLFTPEELLTVLQAIELEKGREREIKWGPRTLDIDILYYDNLVMSSDTLTIPHIDMHNRKFVLEPLCDIAPNKIHPVLMKTTSQLLKGLE